MRKKIRHYPQHPLDPSNPTMETCGAACVLMLLDYYGRIPYPTPKMEHTIYRRYKVNGYKGMTGAAVARCLSDPKEALDKYLTNRNKTLDVHLVQSYEEKMDNCGDLFPREDYEKIMESHSMHFRKCKDRVRISAGVEFDCVFLMEALKAGKKIILELFIPEVEGGPPSVLHWVILEDYDDEKGLFQVCDPLPRRERCYLTAREVESYMDTPIGKICITVCDATEQKAV